MRALLFGDAHIDQGAHLGSPDDELGSTRLRDAAASLVGIAEAAQGAPVIFGGDLARTAQPSPLALRVFIDALAGVEFFSTIGNHDYRAQREATGVHVVTRALHGKVADRPTVFECDGLQIGLLPWTPAGRLFEKAPQGELNRVVEDRLVQIIAGMSEKLNRDRPSVLVGHFTVGDDVPEIVRRAEPVLRVDALESVSHFDLNAFSHYHLPGQVGQRTWRIGPLQRSSFAEAELTPGYLEARWDGPVVSVGHRELPDRELLTFDITEGISVRDDLGPVKDAIVRVRYQTVPERAQEMAGVAALFMGRLQAAGAAKVIGPEVTVERVERARRTELAADVHPLEALGDYMEREDVPVALRTLALREAQEIL